ncbi:MAG TPA: AzlD domain-containing protein [Desulfobacteria bacterium]|nr:AzlD domain-containing protein [Desulfobacteria bacterium]
MQIETKIYLLILGLWIVNYLPRMFPMLVLSRLNIPEPIIQWLGFIPAAVLSAITVQSILMPDNHLFISLQNDSILSAVPTFATAIKTRSLVWTLIAGMLSMALIQLW